MLQTVIPLPSLSWIVAVAAGCSALPAGLAGNRMHPALRRWRDQADRLPDLRYRERPLLFGALFARPSCHPPPRWPVRPLSAPSLASSLGLDRGTASRVFRRFLPSPSLLSGRGFRQRVLKPLVLWTVEDNCVYVLAGCDLKSERDVVARLDLVHEPADTVGFLSRWVFVGSHGAAGAQQRSGFRDGAV